MTKCIVLGDKPYSNALKPINLIKVIEVSGNTCHTSESRVSLKEWSYIELICKNFCSSEYDLMYAYNHPDNRRFGHLYLGYWNDGIV